jgi:pimeloyl-ACP methyl ester carboxylesterase
VLQGAELERVMNSNKRPRWLMTLALALAGIAAAYTAFTVAGTMFAFRIPRLPLEGSMPQSARYEEVSFPSRVDNVNLKGWLVGGEAERAIILVHGGYQTRVDENVDTIGLAHDLAAKGYDLLLFDLRGRGESGGRGRALHDSDRDIGGAIDFLEARGYELDHVALMGFCSGAVSSLVFSTEQDVGAVVLDGAFPTLEGMVVRQAVQRHIPASLVELFIPGIRLAAKTLYGFKDVEPIDIVTNIKAPALFIHEENDDIVSWEETRSLYFAASDPDNEIWQVPGALHSQGYRTAPSVFVDKVDSFLSRTLGEENGP